MVNNYGEFTALGISIPPNELTQVRDSRFDPAENGAVVKHIYLNANGESAWIITAHCQVWLVRTDGHSKRIPSETWTAELKDRNTSSQGPRIENLGAVVVDPKDEVLWVASHDFGAVACFTPKHCQYVSTIPLPEDVNFVRPQLISAGHGCLWIRGTSERLATYGEAPDESSEQGSDDDDDSSRRESKVELFHIDRDGKVQPVPRRLLDIAGGIPTECFVIGSSSGDRAVLVSAYGRMGDVYLLRPDGSIANEEQPILRSTAGVIRHVSPDGELLWIGLRENRPEGDVACIYAIGSAGIVNDGKPCWEGPAESSAQAYPFGTGRAIVATASTKRGDWSIREAVDTSARRIAFDHPTTTRPAPFAFLSSGDISVGRQTGRSFRELLLLDSSDATTIRFRKISGAEPLPEITTFQRRLPWVRPGYAHGIFQFPGNQFLVGVPKSEGTADNGDEEDELNGHVESVAVGILKRDGTIEPMTDIGHRLNAGVAGVVPTIRNDKFWLFLSDGGFAWLSASGSTTADVQVQRGEVSPVRPLIVREVYPAGDGKTAWFAEASVPPAWYIAGAVNSGDDFSTATLGFPAAGVELNKETICPTALSVDPRYGEWISTLTWKGRGASRSDAGQMRLSVRDGDREIGYASDSEVGGADGRQARESNRFTPHWTEIPKWDTPYTIELTYSDAFNSRVKVAWPAVQFSVPLLSRPAFRGFVFAAIVVIAAGVLTVVGLPLLERWGAPMMAAMASVPSLFENVRTWLNIDPFWFFGTLTTAFCIALPLGLVYLPVFRILSRAEPFRQVASLALLLPRARGRLYSNYLKKRLMPRLAQGRDDAMDEKYVEIPAACECNLPGKALTGDILLPAQQIVALLTGRSEAHPHILIESPGGRGKSALLREVTRQLAEKFLEDPRNPLPVLCEAQFGGMNQPDDIAKMVGAALDEFQPMPEELVDQVNRGFFVLMIDGLSESTLTSSFLQQYVGVGRTSRIVATSRSNPAFHAAVRHADDWAIVEPKPLDASTIAAFLNAYSSNMTVDELEGCRSADGRTFLQMHVRMALKLGGTSAYTIRDLYDATFDKLISKVPPSALMSVGDVRARTRDMCLEFYWERAERRLQFANARQDQKNVLQFLKDAGIIIPGGVELAHVREPQYVRFVHDSMQTFLTAAALSANYDADEDSLCLVLRRAAGCPLFVELDSEANAKVRSELFDMCVCSLRDPMRVIVKDLTALVNGHADFLMPSDVHLALEVACETGTDPLPDRLSRIGDTISVQGPGAALLDMAEILKLDSQIMRLGRVYVLIAERLWDRSTKSRVNSALKIE